MTRFKLGLIIATVLVTFVFLVIAWTVKRPGSSGNATIPEPVSYAKPSPDGRFVLVAFGEPDVEAKLTDAMLKASATSVRSTYAKPGLYRSGETAAPIFELSGYAPDDSVFVSADGRHVVRVEGEWWKTKAYPAGKRLSAEREAEQLQAPALSWYADGVLAGQWKLNELIDRPGELPHSPDHILWPAGAVLNASTNQFHLFTQDSNKITLDLTTGVLSKSKTGLGNPIAQWTIGIAIGLTLLLAAAVGWWAWRTRKTVNAASRATKDSASPEAETRRIAVP